MRQGNNQRRGRGRSGRRPNVPNRNQTFDSNGPEGRVRGTAQQVYDKYLALARDAQVSGDRILAENFLQFAEHYFRVLNDSTDPDDNRDRQRENGDSRQARGYEDTNAEDTEDDEESSSDGGQPTQVNGGGRERPHRRDQRRDDRPRMQDRRGTRGDRSPQTAELAASDDGRDKSSETPDASGSAGGEGASKPFETAPPLSERRARRQSRGASREDEPADLLSVSGVDDAVSEAAESQKEAAAQSPAEEGVDEGLRKILGDRPRRAPRRRRAPASGNGETKTAKAKAADASSDAAGKSGPAKDDTADKSDAKLEEPGSAAT